MNDQTFAGANHWKREKEDKKRKKVKTRMKQKKIWEKGLWPNEYITNIIQLTNGETLWFGWLGHHCGCPHPSSLVQKKIILSKKSTLPSHPKEKVYNIIYRKRNKFHHLPWSEIRLLRARHVNSDPSSETVATNETTALTLAIPVAIIVTIEPLLWLCKLAQSVLW